MPKQRSYWTGLHTLAVLAIVALVIVVGLKAHDWGNVFGGGPSSGPLKAWIAMMILFLIFIVVVGHGITGLWAGALIDDRNKMSLSRLQMILWSILVLAALITAALSNIMFDPTGTPLAIAIPGELLLAMGISTTSLIGSPLILNSKRATPNQAEFNQTLSILTSRDDPGAKYGNEGLIVTKAAPKDAQLDDLFRGEETGNAAQIDLSKIQMFYVTLILLVAYGAAIGAAFADVKGLITALPAIDASFIALLGISHAGYLTSKVAPHSKTQADPVSLAPDVVARLAPSIGVTPAPVQTPPPPATADTNGAGDPQNVVAANAQGTS